MTIKNYKKPLPLSATIITFNEEKNIARALKSIDWAAEVIVLDSFSVDRTAEIARDLGAKVSFQKFAGHIAQKQKAVELAKHKWIFSIDADEFVSEELKRKIIKLFEKNDLKYDGYQVNRRNFHFGRWIKHGGWYPDRKIRLFRKDRAFWGGVNPHDKVIVNGKVARIKADLWHYTFADLAHNVRANNQYSSISAKILADKQQTAMTVPKMIGKPIFKFIHCYIIKRGFLDGIPGLIIAVGAAYSMFLRYAKLWEHKLHAKQ